MSHHYLLHESENPKKTQNANVMITSKQYRTQNLPKNNGFGLGAGSKISYFGYGSSFGIMHIVILLYREFSCQTSLVAPDFLLRRSCVGFNNCPPPPLETQNNFGLFCRDNEQKIWTRSTCLFSESNDK